LHRAARRARGGRGGRRGVRHGALPQRADPRPRRTRGDQHVHPAAHRRRAARMGERGAARGRGSGPGRARHRRAVDQHPGRADGRRRRYGRRPQGHARRGRGVPAPPLLAGGTGDHRAESLPAPRSGGRGPVRRPLSAGRAVHDRRRLRRLAEGPGQALRRRRRVRPHLLDRAMIGSSAVAALTRGRWVQPSVLPGFGLTLGTTSAFLAAIVLIPLAAWVLQGASLPLDELWRIATEPRALASYRLSFGAALLAASLNAVFGFIIAWTLVRYSFPGRRLVDAIIDLPFALPTAVSGIALATVFAPQGWLGRWLAPLGIQVAYSWLGVVVALTLIGLPFVVRSVQ